MLKKVLLLTALFSIFAVEQLEARAGGRGARSFSRSSSSRGHMSSSHATPKSFSKPAAPSSAHVAAPAKVAPATPKPTVSAPVHATPAPVAAAPAVVHHHHTREVQTPGGSTVMPFVTGALVGHAVSNHTAAAAEPAKPLSDKEKEDEKAKEQARQAESKTKAKMP